MRTKLAIAAVALAALMPTRLQAGNTWGTDMSDLWWNPNESGWGANIAHQGEIIFLTLFVYGPDGSVRWYVGPSLISPGGTGLTFQGALYQTTGPYFAGSFNPSNVSSRQVGTATLSFPVTSQGTLSYTVDGVVVVKTIQRQTFRLNDPTGSYLGGVKTTASGCVNNGTFSGALTIGISQAGSTGSVALAGAGGTCTITGTYSQLGRMGNLTGSIACANGAAGTANVYEIEVARGGFTAQYSANYGSGCTENGQIAGVKQ